MMKFNLKKITTMLASLTLFTTLALPVNAEINKSTGLPEFGVENGSIADWISVNKATDSKKTYFEISSEKAYLGSYSIKGIDPSDKDSVAIVSPLVEIIPGETYSGSAQMFNNVSDGRGSIIIKYYDADKKAIDKVNGITIDYSTHQSTKGAWTYTKVDGKTAPANAKYISIGPSISLVWTTSATYWDDFKLYGNFPEAPAVGEYSFSAADFVKVDENYALTLTTSNNDDLYSIIADLEYDPTLLEFDSVKGVGEFANAVTTVDESTAGKVSVVATLIGEKGVSVNTDVLTFNFVPIDAGPTNVKLLTTTITAKVNGDSTGKTFSPAKEIVHSFNILHSILDVNNDGKINLVDLTTVAYYVGTEATEATAKYDLNADGKIDIADLGVIATTIFNQ